VEGDDDLHAIVHLLLRHGIDYDSQPWLPALPEVKKAGSIEKLLAAVETEVMSATGRVVGFVLDADSPLSARWQALRDRLVKAGVNVPELPVAEGFVGHSQYYQSTVGAWLMPDNQHDGTLESLLETLIAETDPIINHATSATDTATQLGAAFRPGDKLKAVLHAWLAWQEEPGLPYGTAIRARFFGHDSPAAIAFVAWFKRLYGVP
jgi:hypothetical protein